MELTKEQRRELLQQLATPPDFWSVINGEFCFEIDVCALPENAKCELYITPDQNALSLHEYWITRDILRAWCNPGFAKVEKWHKKAYTEAQCNPSAVVAVIGLAGGSQDWFEFAYHKASEIRILKDRVQYIPPPGIEDKGNSRESWLYIYRRKVTKAPAPIVLWDWKSEIA